MKRVEYLEGPEVLVAVAVGCLFVVVLGVSRIEKKVVKRAKVTIST